MGRGVNHERRKVYDRMRAAGTEVSDIEVFGRAQGRVPVPVMVLKLRELARSYHESGERPLLARINFLYHDLAERRQDLAVLGVTPEQLGLGSVWLRYRRGKI